MEVVKAKQAFLLLLNPGNRPLDLHVQAATVNTGLLQYGDGNFQHRNCRVGALCFIAHLFDVHVLLLSSVDAIAGVIDTSTRSPSSKFMSCR